MFYNRRIDRLNTSKTRSTLYNHHVYLIGSADDVKASNFVTKINTVFDK